MKEILYISFIADKSINYYRYGRPVSDIINEKDWILNSLNKDDRELVNVNIIQYNPQIDISSFRDYDIIILGGSELNISSDAIPWLSKIVKEIRILEKTEVKILGICFGHQLLAYTYGCEIKKHEDIKFGVKKLNLTKCGLQSSLLSQCPDSFYAYFSHFDFVKKISTDITLTILDFDSICYGFDIGQNIHGFQFHPEIPKEVMLSLFESKYEYFNINELNKIKLELNSIVPDVRMRTFLAQLEETKVANNV